MVELRKITHKNIEPLVLNLQVAKEQEDFVASNMTSLAQAYVSITNGGFATPYAIYNGDLLVGFVMYTYADSWGGDMDEPYAVPCYYIWRLFIDINHQRKGYGKQAVEKIIAEIKTKPHGKADRIYVSWHPDNIGSKTLFTSLGFKETGQKEGDADDDEIIAKLDI
ncbi:GNAT family N-acetyltransferase [Tyzzerella sp. OttesenSCG-928-J15]|nr:GNAT family N-acetyltransferase [Tyzzerella sp. OttesenSCG-928-J15]